MSVFVLEEASSRRGSSSATPLRVLSLCAKTKGFFFVLLINIFRSSSCKTCFFFLVDCCTGSPEEASEKLGCADQYIGYI